MMRSISNPTPDRTGLIAEIRAICEPHFYCPSLAAVVAACDTGTPRNVSQAVNAALRDPSLRSPTLRRHILDWGARVNAAREQTSSDRGAAA